MQAGLLDFIRRLHIPRLLCAFLSLAMTLVTGMGCVSSTTSGIHYASGEEAQTTDGLYAIKWTPFQLIFVRPGARIQNYRKLIIDPLSISYERTPDRGRAGAKSFASYTARDPNYAVPDSTTAAMKKFYRDYLTSQLVESGRFEEVSMGGDGVLRVRGHISGLTLSAQPMVDQPPDGTSMVADSGHMTLTLDLVDTKTGEALIRVADLRRIGDEHGYHTSEITSQHRALRSIFEKWAADLRRQIDRLSALSEIPAPAN